VERREEFRDGSIGQEFLRAHDIVAVFVGCLPISFPHSHLLALRSLVMTMKLIVAVFF
jgi:hypothetical protein